jgi:outer membrane protease
LKHSLRFFEGLTYKKIVSAHIYALLVCTALYSKDLMNGSLGIDMGYITGTTNEYVYKDGKTISHLEWKENLIPAFQFHSRFDIIGIFLSLDMLSVLPLAIKSGVISDYDYLLDNSDMLSNYSEHDLYTDKHFNLSFRIGYTFVFWRFTMSPTVGFSYYTRKWSAVNGYLQYPTNDDEPLSEETPKNNVLGTGINYEQLLKFFSIGVESGYTMDLFDNLFY